MKVSLKSPSNLIITDTTPPPIPYTERDVVDKFWQPEDFDPVVPQGGFLSDFVLSTRGVETPTRFSAWSAVFLLSTALYRDTWIEWGPLGKLFPNFYVVFVAEPRVSPKSTAVNFGMPILENLPTYFDDHQLKIQKTLNLIKSKATPEALGQALRAKKEIVTIDDEEYEIVTDSKCGIIVSELSTFLGKQKYNLGLVDQLTDWYDCPDHSQDLTIARGTGNMRNVYLTLFGATTPDGLEQSIPSVALGGGFLSRMILVYNEVPQRVFPFPRQVVGAPDRTELTRRLAWIAHNARGPYTFAPEANDFYQNWYYKYRSEHFADLNAHRRALTQRFDIHVMKLALLMRAQRYVRGNVIQKSDFEAALNFLEKTYDNPHKLLSNIGAGDYTKAYNAIVGILSRQPYRKMTRRQLLPACSSRGISADEVTKVINQLVQEEAVEIMLHGKVCRAASSKGIEIYTLAKRFNIA